VDPGRDLVTVDGALVSEPDEKSYYLLYKPSGCVTTAADPEGRPTALEYLAKVPGRLFPVGRLDYDAEGAVLFTDDGELANRLAHPRYGHRRVYLVKVRGDPEAEALERMKAGLRLEDGPAQALEAVVHEHAEKNVWIRIVVGEGRYHLVKRLCEAVGLQVQRLFRPEFGGITVEGLRPGQFRALSSDEVEGLLQRVGLAAPPAGRVAPRAAFPALPKAARRHGHGPPPPPSAEPAPRPRPAGASNAADRRPERGADRRPERGADRRPERGADRRPERDADRRPERGADHRPERDADRRPERSAERTPGRPGRRAEPPGRGPGRPRPGQRRGR
jgi:23S rRNA pseudouridine2605 synthase